MKKYALILLISCMAISAVADVHRNRVPQGGGVVYPAWHGEYWMNPDLSGAPDYTRSDIRIRFDWEDWRPILGVHAESVRDFPTDNFSARWTGTIIARFGEEYTFELESDEQARIKIKPVDSEEWKTLIDAWKPHKRRIDTATIKLEAGARYDMVVEYAEKTGDAVCSLRWSSPSAPKEVLDYVAGNCIQMDMPQAFADLFCYNGTGSMSAERPVNSATRGGIEVDENGWPVTDFKVVLIVGYTHYTGRGLLSFKGQADVKLSSAQLEVDGKMYDTLPSGAGYDPVKNETRAFIHWTPRDDGVTSTTLEANNSRRSPNSPEGSGLTDIHVMLPKQEGGTEPHEPGEVINQEARDAYNPVFAFRIQRTGLNDIVKWSERTLPSYSKVIGQVWRADMAYEKLIMAANEFGRDLYLCYSGSCDEEFMRNLAYLSKYGSDGVNPYTEPTPNPAYPPLSPHLRFYLEHGNEMGWSAIQPRDWTRIDYERIRREKSSPEWNVLNFDGAIEDDHHFGVMRYHAYRTVRMSENMRAVWGDDAMGEIIRVCLFGQYERWFQNGMVQFINDYYNNPEYVDTPRAPAEILWASGPAVYYGTVNNFMVSDTFHLSNGNFEDSAVGAGEIKLNPKVNGWSFEGNAGLLDVRGERHQAVANRGASGAVKIKGKAAVGFQFTVGDRDLYVYEVGRVMQEGEKGKALTTIVDAKGNALHTSKHLTTSFKKMKPGDVNYTHLEYCGWATTDSSRIGVWKLEAGKSYAVVTEVNNITMPSGKSSLQAGPGITIDGAVMARGASVGTRGVGGKLEKISGSGSGFPLVTFRYAFAREPAPGMAIAAPDFNLDPDWNKGGKGKSYIPPYHRQGTKAAFLAGRGKLSQKFTLDKDGEYALVFTAVGSLNSKGRDGDNRFTIHFDDTEVWNDVVGGGRKPNGAVFQWGTRYTELSKGEHRLVIESTSDDPSDTVYIYSMHLGDIMDYCGGPTASNFLGAGAATSQTEGRFSKVVQLSAAMAQLWGLVPFAYEGGTQAGGDWNGGKLNYPKQFKWDHPISKVADNQWARFWYNYGGYDAFYLYPGFEDKYIFKAETYMPWAACIERARNWELEPEGPAPAPIVFTPDQLHYQGEPKSRWDGWYHPWSSEKSLKEVTDQLDHPERWKGFIFRAPKTGEYTVTAHTSAGGELALLVNDSQAVVKGPSGSPVKAHVLLHQGVHSIKVKNLSGSFALMKVEIK